MGILNKCLTFDQGLVNATMLALDQWKAGFPGNCCERQEHNFEALIRTNIGPLKCLVGNNKKCCAIPDSAPFTHNCHELTNGVWQTHQASWSNDIYYNDRNKQIIVEIKIIFNKYFPYLTNNNLINQINYNYVNHISQYKNLPVNPITIPASTVPASTVQIVKPHEPKVYFSHFGEGKLWHDIIRLESARRFFHTNQLQKELYLLLFSDVQLNRLNNVLSVFGKKFSGINYLYHDLGNQIFKSATIDFEYNLTTIRCGNNGKIVYLVRIT